MNQGVRLSLAMEGSLNLFAESFYLYNYQQDIAGVDLQASVTIAVKIPNQS
jgi:hypothetical protein